MNRIATTFIALIILPLAARAEIMQATLANDLPLLCRALVDGDHDVRHRSQQLDGPACRNRLRPRSMRFVPRVTSAKHATC